MKEESFWLKFVAFLLMAVVFMLAIVIYNIYFEKRNGNGEVVTVPDTIKSVPPLPVDPTPKKSLQNDYKWARVQGPVKFIRETIISNDESSWDTISSTVINFDKNGIVIPDKSTNKYIKYTRNKNGQITKLVKKYDSQVSWILVEGECISNEDADIYTYKYDNSGYINYEYHKYTSSLLGEVMSSDTEHSYFTLNDRGWILSSKCKWTSISDDYRSSSTTRSSYTYSNEDYYGNWLKAVVKEKDGSSQSQKIITRYITYWE